MSTVTLDYLYVHLASDPDTFLTFELDAESVTTSKVGSVRVGASGRRRAIFNAGSDYKLSITTEQVDRADYKTLETWVAEGRTLLIRDTRERAVWGVVFSTSATEVWPNFLTVTFEVATVTYDEEV